MSATLSGIVREKLGSRHARVLRLQGRIPANVQGGGREDVNFSIEEDVFLAARRHHEHLFDIDQLHLHAAVSNHRTCLIEERSLSFSNFIQRSAVFVRGQTQNTPGTCVLSEIVARLLVGFTEHSAKLNTAIRPHDDVVATAYGLISFR